jgi:hypothetical protein
MEFFLSVYLFINTISKKNCSIFEKLTQENFQYYMCQFASNFFSIEFEFNSIQVACNVIQYVHLNGT